MRCVILACLSHDPNEGVRLVANATVLATGAMGVCFVGLWSIARLHRILLDTHSENRGYVLAYEVLHLDIEFTKEEDALFLARCRQRAKNRRFSRPGAAGVVAGTRAVERGKARQLRHRYIMTRCCHARYRPHRQPKAGCRPTPPGEASPLPGVWSR